MQFVLTDLEWNVEHDANNDKNFIYKNALFSYFTIQKQKIELKKKICLGFVYLFLYSSLPKNKNNGM